MKNLKRWAMCIIAEVGDRYQPANGMRLTEFDDKCFYKNAYRELYNYIWRYKMDYRSDDPLRDAIDSFMDMAYQGVKESKTVISYKIFFAMVEVAQEVLEVFEAAE